MVQYTQNWTEPELGTKLQAKYRLVGAKGFACKNNRVVLPVGTQYRTLASVNGRDTDYRWRPSPSCVTHNIAHTGPHHLDVNFSS